MSERLPELPALTGLRGFAALWVLLFHAWALSGAPALAIPGTGSVQLGWFMNLGWAGVDLFFCLSAFLLVLPFAQWRYGGAPRPDTGRYLLRRVLRIYPAYIAQLTLLLLVAAVFGYGQTLDGKALVAHMFLWFNLGEPRFDPLLGVWFTLPIEFGFYLLLPLIAPLIDRRYWPWLLIAALAVTLVTRYLLHLAYLGVSEPMRVIMIERLPGRLDQFVIGMLGGAAFVAASLAQWRPRQPALWLFAGLVGIALLGAVILRVGDAYWRGHPLLFVWHTLFSVCLVPILLASAWGVAPVAALLANRPLRYLGEISFGVYLWHMPILVPILAHLPDSMDPAARFWSLLAFVVPATVMVAHLSHRFIEQPFLRRKPPHRTG
ncbi:MAG: acyltransferase [Dokdonella sp.]|nr:acyltransferase [Dokdonella sp.]MCB1571280.1 acyltransferase [Xanthomonadales bacterium]MCB1572585.1 acyltransferase [Xanthomonadales bacterium]MCB1578086.1 acyltransferase [Xanthomonadales bacterium]